MRQEKKIPTILGLLILIASIIAGVFLTRKPIIFQNKASGDCQPTHPQISNVTDHSFALSFLTSADCLTTVNLPDRTIDGPSTPSKSHYFQIDNLKPNTDYRPDIISGGNSFSPPEVKTRTGIKPTSPLPTSNLAWGKVFLPNNQPASGVIVFLTIDGNIPLSAITNDQGYWNISLANCFNKTKDDWFTPPLDTAETISVFATDASITILDHNTSKNNPVPDITIGQNYFSQTSTDTSAVNFPTASAENSFTKDLTISNPNEGETVSTLRPQFFGTAPLNSQLTIKIESSPVYTDSVTSQTDGSWTWAPPANLSPGEHTITLTATDPQSGILKTITRKFIVQASEGSDLAFSASASASLITPTLTPIPTTEIIPTAIPSPTSIPTAAPTVRTAKPSVTGIPVTGNSSPTIFLIAFAGLFFIFGYFYWKKDSV